MGWNNAEFRRTVERHQSMVFSIALRLTCDRPLAEEVAQDAFLELYRSSDRLADDDHCRFWLRRVTVHRSVDALRRRRRQPEAQAEEWMEEVHAEPEPEGGYALEARVEELLRGLPEALRAGIVLRYQEGLGPEEIARVLGQPMGTVKSNLQRGLALLRRKAAVVLKEYVRGSV